MKIGGADKGCCVLHMENQLARRRRLGLLRPTGPFQPLSTPFNPKQRRRCLYRTSWRCLLLGVGKDAAFRQWSSDKGKQKILGVPYSSCPSPSAAFPHQILLDSLHPLLRGTHDVHPDEFVVPYELFEGRARQRYNAFLVLVPQLRVVL